MLPVLIIQHYPHFLFLATGGYDHKIRFWDATSGSCTRTIQFGDSQVNCLQISSNKSLLAAGEFAFERFYIVNRLINLLIQAGIPNFKYLI
jgi:WD40 repeat protein